jgi:hypothetical protein
MSDLENTVSTQAPVDNTTENAAIETNDNVLTGKSVETATPAADQKVTAEDKTQIDAVAELISSKDLPQGVKYFKDQAGKLQFLVPIDGTTYQVSFPEMVKGFNLNQAGYKRLEESKNMMKMFEQFIANGKTNPDVILNLLEKLGHDKYAIAQKLLEEKVKLGSMSEEEKELYTAKMEREKWLKEKKEWEAAKEKDKISKESEQLQNKYSEELLNALTKHGFKDNSFKTMKGVAKRAVELVKHAAGKNIELTFDDAVFQAKQEWQAYVQDFMKHIDTNYVKDMFPAEVLEAAMKQKLAGNVVTPTAKSVGGKVDLKASTTVEKKSKKKVPISDYFSKL